MSQLKLIRWFESIENKDVSIVGGKNASLGEMTHNLKNAGISVPDGFATTTEAYWTFLTANKLTGNIATLLDQLENEQATLPDVGNRIRNLILNAQLPDALSAQMIAAYKELGKRYDADDVAVAVRSSATAEDLPEASFAGQHESFLNVCGEDALLKACIKCYASLFTDRAITYRRTLGIDSMNVALSIGVQKMVHAECAGIAFTLDTETGFPDVVLISGAWGLGENIVKGIVTPDQYTVFKPFLESPLLRPIIEKTLGAKKQKLIYATHASSDSVSQAAKKEAIDLEHWDDDSRFGPNAAHDAIKHLTLEEKSTTVNVDTTEEERSTFVLNDEEILTLSHWSVFIEQHYKCPMDIEWARDETSSELFILQARPETVQSRREATALTTYRLKQKGERIIEGLAIGDAIASGHVCLIKSASDIDRFVDGSVLVTETTDPDWVPIMKRAAGIITDHGGRTSHAAIVSRELGVAAIVGTENSTRELRAGQAVTLSCAEGDRGYVYEGILDYEEQELNLKNLPTPQTQIMINIASPSAAMRWWRLPARGVGLARMEYLINNVIKIHPMALVHFEELEDEDAKEQIESLTRGYAAKTDYFVDHLARGIATIAASQYPDKVIVRTSDFKTNEYARLIGGQVFEPNEENPMLGWRGASRYYSDAYREGFDLECRALKMAREEIGFTNIVVMIPFCRTPEEADRVLNVMKENGLRRGDNGLEVYVMAEIPSNIVLAEEFAQRFDGFSIGSNDLTQLVLGVDRDSEKLAFLFDERNDAVKSMIRNLIERAHSAGRPVGICGQGPSDHPDFAAFLVDAGIDTISLLPDSVLGVLQQVAVAEQKCVTNT